MLRIGSFLWVKIGLVFQKDPGRGLSFLQYATSTSVREEQVTLDVTTILRFFVDKIAATRKLEAVFVSLYNISLGKW